jgi:hypothetical protein
VSVWTRVVTLSRVSDPPYPPISGQPTPPDPRQLQEWQLRQAGYTPAQIEALMRPLPPLPPQYLPAARDWAFVAFLILVGLVVLGCVVGVIVAAVNTPS